jgi:hypothetical protein
VNQQPASVLVHAPDGSSFAVALHPGRVQIGRPAPGHDPDIVLEPDPERWVGRLHCVLEFDTGAWWLVDNGTVNGTFLRRHDSVERVEGRVRLRANDVIRILGGMDSDDGGLRYWELTLLDPHATTQAPRPPRRPAPPPEGGWTCVEYDWAQARLYRRDGDRREEVEGLSPLLHKLVRHMAGAGDGGAPVACTHAELIEAVWGTGDGTPFGFTTEHLRDLVSELRKRLEPGRARGEPSRLLETIPGIGYRLRVCG